VSDIERLLRPHVPAVPRYVTARSLHRGGLLMDANENGLGTPVPELGEDLHRYPDPANGDLRRAVAKWIGVPAERLWFGNGSDEIIDLLIRLFADPETPVVVPTPSYGMYAQRAAASGVEVRTVRLDAAFDLDVEATLAATSDAAGPRLVLLCSPNNPTGNLLSGDRVLELVRRCDAIVAVDEAYVEFAGGDARAESLAALAGDPTAFPGAERLAVIRTLSKAWGLAGARVGYLVAVPDLIDAMDRVGLPYPLSSLAAGAAVRAIETAALMEQGRIVLVAERERVGAHLAELGLRVLPSDANFLLFFVTDAGEVQRRLASEHGVVIRDRSHMPGLMGGLRVTIGAPPDNDRFLAALREVLG